MRTGSTDMQRPPETSSWHAILRRDRAKSSQIGTNSPVVTRTRRPATGLLGVSALCQVNKGSRRTRRSSRLPSGPFPADPDSPQPVAHRPRRRARRLARMGRSTMCARRGSGGASRRPWRHQVTAADARARGSARGVDHRHGFGQVARLSAARPGRDVLGAGAGIGGQVGEGAGPGWRRRPHTALYLAPTKALAHDQLRAGDGAGAGSVADRRRGRRHPARRAGLGPRLRHATC